MALPNPFGSNLSLQPSFTKTIPNKNLTVNPGPGLPQALQPSYNDVNVIRKHQNDSKHNESNFNRFGFSNSQYCAFSCDRCDRSFKTQELLNSHISEHISCGINGCTFVAHPKIVEKHVEMQHETGLAEQIMRLNTPEEIQKWREARKKNFPSAANITRRQAEQQEKADRGEVLYEPKKKFARSKQHAAKGWDARTGQKRQVQKRGLDDSIRNHQSQEKSLTVLAQQASLHKPVETGTTPSQTSTSMKKELSDGKVSDNEVIVKLNSPIRAHALASLSSYASDSDEVVEVKKVTVSPEENTEPLKKTNSEHPPKRRKKGKAPTSKVTQAANQQLRPKRLTLLQKLLQGEILHERNTILQCVHYVVQQDFFGVYRASSIKIKVEPSNTSD